MIHTRTPDTDTPKPDSCADYRTVKAWFQQCRDLAAAIEVQKQKIQRIRDVAEKCTQSLSGMPAGGGNGDKVGFAVEQLDTERRQLQRMETDLCNLRIEATRRAYCLTSARQAGFICRFYIDGKSLNAIAAEEKIKNNSTVCESIRLGCTYLAEMFNGPDDWRVGEITQKLNRNFWQSV